MLAQQGLGIWGLVNGAGNASTELSMNELLVQAKVCRVDILFSGAFIADSAESFSFPCPRHGLLVPPRSSWPSLRSTCASLAQQSSRDGPSLS